MALNFRTLFYSLLPTRFTNGEGEKVLYSLGVIKDAYVSRLRLGLEARMPSRAGKSALTLIGQDRGIPRGRAEVAAHYAARLIGWRYPRGHRVRGSAFALLDQIGEYFGGIRAWTIDVKGNYHLRTFDGVTSSQYNFFWQWDTTPVVPNWGRFWVVIEPGSDVPSIAAWPTLAAAYAGGGGVGQSGLGPDDAAAIRNLFRGPHPWKPSGTRAEWLIVNLDSTQHNPDASWAHFSKMNAGTQQAARYAGWRYIALYLPNLNYPGNPDNFCTLFFLVGGTTYGGNPVSFATTIPLSRGGTYAGNTDSFPASIRLGDDGELP